MTTKKLIYMTQADFLKRLEECYQEALEISRRKNADYAGDDNAFANFQAGETFGLDTKVGILQRMLDKMTRVSNLLKPGAEAKVKDEAVTDTLADLANYATILRIYVEQELKANAPTYAGPSFPDPGFNERFAEEMEKILRPPVNPGAYPPIKDGGPKLPELPQYPGTPKIWCSHPQSPETLGTDREMV